jgi:hypothetical protein
VDKTSAEERNWARLNYGKQLKKHGKAYFDITWTDENPPPLQGKEYSLMNMKKYGGVCSCQADYAASLCRITGTPAFWVNFHPRSGETGHAWVIWFETNHVTNGKISFSFQETGNYSGDRLAVAKVRGPQTSEYTDDCAILLEAHRVGLSVQKFRFAKLILKCYDTLVQKENLSPQKQLELLKKINALSPGHDQVWRKILTLGQEGKLGKEKSV